MEEVYDGMLSCTKSVLMFLLLAPKFVELLFYQLDWHSNEEVEQPEILNIKILIQSSFNVQFLIINNN